MAKTILRNSLFRNNRTLDFSSSTTMFTGKSPQSIKQSLIRRLLSTATALSASKKNKDAYYEEKMPVYDYNKMNDQKKRMYVFGSAHNGAIGLENLVKPKDPEDRVHHYMQKPTRHKFAEFHEVTDVAAGHEFTLIAIKPRVNNGPMVFGCGSNSFSQLGYQASREAGPLETLLSVVPLPLIGQKSSRVLAIGAGRGHSLISVEGEGLYSLGDNSSGQCGREPIQNEKYFGSKYLHRFSRFVDDPIITICSRFDLSLCVTKSGKVYTFGDNSKGQLGRGKGCFRPWQPQYVEGDLQGEKVKKLATSGSSVLAVTENGDLFSWGCNECGQSNPAEISTISYHPKHIKFSNEIGKIMDVAMGDYFSFILNQQGQVYVWGQGKSLGLGPKTFTANRATLIPPPLFGQNEFYPDVQVTNIYSSFMYSAAINSKGDFFTWGKDIKGCLGLGKMNYQSFPLRVSLGAAAKRATLGIDHTIVIAKGAL